MSEKDNPYNSVPTPELDGLNLQEATPTETINPDNDSITSRRKDVLTRLLNDLLKKLNKEEVMTDDDEDRYLNWIAIGFGKVSYSHVLRRRAF